MKKYGKRPGLKKLDVGARKVAGTFGKEAIATFVHKGGGMLVFENDSERLVAHALGFDPRVRRFQPQPFTVDLVEGRILRTAEQRQEARRKHAGRKGPALYTPDFGVELSSDRQLVIEVKLDTFLGDQVEQDRLAAATTALASYGYAVARVVIPSQTSHPLRSNITLLHLAATRADLRPNDEVVARVDLLAASGASTVADYVGGLKMSVNYIPALIAYGILSADLIAHRIEFRMPITPAYGSLDHLQLVERLTR